MSTTHKDPMTKKAKIAKDGGDEDMPQAGAAPRVGNSTSGNPAAKKVATVKGTPKNNGKHKHVKRVARY